MVGSRAAPTRGASRDVMTSVHWVLSETMRWGVASTVVEPYRWSTVTLSPAAAASAAPSSSPPQAARAMAMARTGIRARRRMVGIPIIHAKVAP